MKTLPDGARGRIQMTTDTARDNSATPSAAVDRRSVEERRQQLIDAAIAVMAERGLTGATTRAITDQADLALGAFHYAFASKDELLSAVIEQVVGEIDGTLGSSLDAAEPRPDDPDGPQLVVEVLSRFITRTWEYFTTTEQLQLAQYELTLYALRDPALRHLASEQYDLYTATVAHALGELPAEVSDDTARELGRYVVATIDGLLLQWLVEGDAEAAQLRLRRYITTLPAIVQAHYEPLD